MSDIRPSRRAVLTAIGLTPLASIAPALVAESQARAAAGSGFRFFSAHQAATVKAAAARLIPGPNDDPIEKALNSPGATEADVVRYIDTMLSLFDDDPPKIFAGGPWSNRSGGHTDYMKHFVHPAPRHIAGWKVRIAELRRQYVKAVKALDAYAQSKYGKDFADCSGSQQDTVLKKKGTERDLIFADAVDGMYSVPEYGGNRNEVGWKSIHWPGDRQPHGYTNHQVERDDGIDPIGVEDLPMANTILGLLKQLGTADKRLWVNRG